MLDMTPPTAAPAYTRYSPRRRWAYLAVLFLVAMSSYADRHVVSILLEPIKREFGVSDTMLGLLSGLAFSALYATLGIPVARWADRGNRRHVITLALVIWSGMTALCGAAHSFWLLLLTRVGVGVGEAGALPPAQSLLVDYFPPHQRAQAIALLLSSATAGYLLAFVGGVWVLEHHGWRTVFVVLGLPGLLLALVTWFGLDEPRERAAFAARAPVNEASFGVDLERLLAKRSFVCTTLGIALYGVVAYGAMVFVPSYMVRILGVSMAEVSGIYAGSSAVSAVIGTVFGGWVADRLGKRDPRWYAWLPAVGLALTLPLQVASLLVGFHALLVLGFLAGILLGASLPSSFTAVHLVCGSPRRSVAVAVMLFTLSLVGAGLGPLITGVLSDLFAARYAELSLRPAMLLTSFALLPAAWAFYVAGRALPAEMEA